MCPRYGDRTMDQCPISIDSFRKEYGVFIFRLQDQAIAFKMVKIFRERQRYTRTFARVGGVDNGIFIEFVNIGDTRIFNAPQFFREALRIRHQGWLSIDFPVIYTVIGAGSTQVGMPAPVFYTA